MARILVIDDDDRLRRFLRRALEGFGYEVATASDGVVGALLFRMDSNIDIVITDMQMPNRDGLEVIRELKRDYPDVKIIACSGKDPSALDRAQEEGAQYAFRKPFDMQEMHTAIKSLLDE